MANLTLFEKLKQIESRYDEITRELSSPEVHDDSARYQKLAKQHSELGEIVAKYRDWKEIEKALEGARQLFAESDDAEMKQMAHDEQQTLEARRDSVEREVKLLLIPKDPNDEKNVILEIRAGTGGDEASLFAAELFRMYSRYAESQKWKVEISGKLCLARRRDEGNRRSHSGQQSLFQTEIRKRRAPRSACSFNRAAGPHPHVCRNGRRAS